MGFEEEVLRLLASFPDSSLLYVKNKENIVLQLEVIVHKPTNTYVRLTDSKDVTGIKRCVIEQLSRPVSKGIPYKTEQRNKQFRAFLLASLNRFLNTDFSQEDMEYIYTHLGNGIRRKTATQFVENGFDMEWLKSQFGKEDAK